MNMSAMFRYRVVLTIFLIGFGLCSGVLSAQNISVKSFRLLETDLTANTAGTMKRDQNNEVSALIKVVTTETGFAFDGGMLGIVGAEQRTGEIWVYVPQKSRKITLSHQKLGVLRDYYYPVPVEAGRTYEMVLTTGKVTTIVQESAGGQYLVMTVTPANAEVSIDDVPVEVADGVVSILLKYGKHTYRVSAALHEPTMGQFEIGNAKKELSVALQPAYGILQIDSDPAGAEVYIDGDYQPAGTTPFTSKWLSPGKHTLQFKMPVYKTRTMEVAVPGNGATQSVEAVLQPNFAEVSVSAPGESEIYINNELKGVGRWSGRLNAGLYTVEARKASHYSSSQSVEVEAGDKRTVTLSALTPRYGSLNVNTRPVGATVSVDGTALMGTTPNIYADILIGEHTLTVAKPGYAEAEQRITVEEGKVLPVSITLTEKEKVAPAPSARTADSQSLSGQGGKKESEPFTVVEVMPVFPGGQMALVQYIASHLKYPTVAQENGIQGRVFVSFVVGEDGYVEDVQVIKGVEPMLDKEAVRVIQSLPRWTPGNQQGKPVRVKYTVPVTFALQ